MARIGNGTVGVGAFMPTTHEGKQWLANTSKLDGVNVLPSGLQYKVVRAAEPGAKSPLETTPCCVHYRGTLIDGTEFDSSHSRGQPSLLAPSEVIKGWREAMQIMAEGDLWIIYVPSELAYGDSMRGRFITPGAVLIFELEMVAVKGDVESKTAVIHTPESRDSLTRPPVGGPPPHAEKGKRIQIIGLEAKPEYNDQLGTVISWDEVRQRAGILLDSGASFALKPANLWPVSSEGDDDGAKPLAAPQAQTPTPTPAPPPAPPPAPAPAPPPPTETKAPDEAPAATVAAPPPEPVDFVPPVDFWFGKGATPSPPTAPPPAARMRTTPSVSISTVPMDAWCTGLVEKQNFFRAPGKEPGAAGVVLVGDDEAALAVTRSYESDVETIGVYSVASGDAIRALKGHSDVVTALAVDPKNPDLLASTGADGTVRVWELSTGKCVAMATVPDALCAVGLCSPYVITGGEHATLWQLDEHPQKAPSMGGVKTGVKIGVQAPATGEVPLLSMLGRQEHSTTVYCVGLCASGHACSVGRNSTEFRMWGAPSDCEESPQPVHVKLPEASGYAMAVEGINVYLGLRNGAVACYELGSGAARHLFTANVAGYEVTSLAVRRCDADVIVAVGCEFAPQAIRIFGLARFVPGRPTPKAKLLANQDSFHPVVSLAFSASGGLLAAMGNDEELEVYAPGFGEKKLAQYNPEDPVEEVQYAKDGVTRLVW